MIESLIFLNIVITLIFFWIIWKIKISMTSVFLSTFIIFYLIGFLVIGFNPDGSVWDYLEPDMRRLFVFPLGTGESQIYFITMVNIGLLFGIVLGFFASPKKVFISDLSTIEEKNQYVLLPLAWFFFGSAISYMILRFYFVPDLPLYKLMIEGGSARLLSDAWGTKKDVLWIFLPSIYMQFLQFFLPISSLLFYEYYNSKKTRDSRSVFIFSLLINFFSLLMILKRAPFIIFGVSIVLMSMIYRSKIRFKNLDNLLYGCFFIIFGILGVTKIQTMNHAPYLSNTPITVERKVPLIYKKNDFDFLEKNFKTSKIPLDFSKNMKKRIENYNNKNYGHVVYKGVMPEALCRIFTGEMIASFVIVGNLELMEYVRKSDPFNTYIQKIFGKKTKNIYESILSILAGQYCAGSTTISTFLEIFIYFGYYSILLYAAIGFLLIRADILIINKFDRSFAPVFVLMMIVVAQAPLKGLMTTIFTVGGVSCLFLFLVFYIYFSKEAHKHMLNILTVFSKKSHNLNFAKIFSKKYLLNR